MSKKTEKAEKSKKKKAAIIITSVIAAILVLVIIAGVCVLNWYCKPGDYEVKTSDKEITLVAHRGFRGVAPENTAPAFMQAGIAGFWGAECDIYRTTDGVWVVQHDPVTYRMTGKLSFVEKNDFDTLYKQVVTNGVNIDKYSDLRICTLGEYLNICKTYDMRPVIELKGDNNIEYYDEIINALSSAELDPIFISFEFEDLVALRKLTDAPLYYLVKEIEEEDIALVQTLENCGIDFDGNKEKNFETGILDKCHEAGIALGAWTIDDLEVVDKLVENDVTLITTNCITPNDSAAQAEAE
ncbi:MAG: hypothetical protein NC397_03340 [Clostridium sp.]|nr:hypothetical protein [Clostridium sp.]